MPTIIPGMIADVNFTFVLGIAMYNHVKTAQATTHGSIRRSMGARSVVEFKKMDIPDVSTINTGTNKSTIM
jgi:hypothetical protein